jgi:hypothetical protein
MYNIYNTESKDQGECTKQYFGKSFCMAMSHDFLA